MKRKKRRRKKKKKKRMWKKKKRKNRQKRKRGRRGKRRRRKKKQTLNEIRGCRIGEFWITFSGFQLVIPISLSSLPRNVTFVSSGWSFSCGSCPEYGDRCLHRNVRQHLRDCTVSPKVTADRYSLVLCILECRN